MVADYRRNLVARDNATETMGWLLPPIGVQLVLARLAGTDLEAQLAYQDRVRAYHRALRELYYPYMFQDRPFSDADFEGSPVSGVMGREDRVEHRRAARSGQPLLIALCVLATPLPAVVQHAAAETEPTPEHAPSPERVKQTSAPSLS